VITAGLSVAAIVVAIAVGTMGRVNVGLVSITFAFGIGHFMVGLPAREIVGGWPLGLFFMLLGMTLLFGIARVNGTLAILAERVVAATVGDTRLMPPVFFLLAGVIAAVGAGNIVVCAIVLPIALTVAVDHRISPLLMATMVIAGSNAGGLSPLAPTGIIANTLSAEQGFDIAAGIFTKQIVGQTILAVILYVLLKGYRRGAPVVATAGVPAARSREASEPPAPPAAAEGPSLDRPRRPPWRSSSPSSRASWGSVGTSGSPPSLARSSSSSCGRPGRPRRSRPSPGVPSCSYAG
jgi:Na+/H+ antiporter NhaC